MPERFNKALRRYLAAVSTPYVFDLILMWVFLLFFLPLMCFKMFTKTLLCPSYDFSRRFEIPPRDLEAPLLVNVPRGGPSGRPCRLSGAPTGGIYSGGRSEA